MPETRHCQGRAIRLLLVLLISFQCAFSRNGIFLAQAAKTHGSSSRSNAKGSSKHPIAVLAASPSSEPVKFSRLERLLHKIYQEADTNRDGSIDFSETYELVLKMYINLNRQAPIPAPSRRQIMKLFLKYDADASNNISEEEFRRLARTLARRALSRLVAHKLVTLVGAPLLAEFVVRKLAGESWPSDLAAFVVPDRFHEKVLPVLTSPNFARTVLLILSISFLGNIVMSTVNWILDVGLLDYDDEDPQTKKRVALIERGHSNAKKQRFQKAHKKVSK